jgi:aryl-alcohol dehydrogenase-like predicted oxidoreductase
MWQTPDQQLLATTRELGVGIVAWSPLAAGFLTGTVHKITDDDFRTNIRFLAVSSGFGDQVRVVPAWWVDEGVIVSLAA